jgi:hypothetical protein
VPDIGASYSVGLKNVGVEWRRFEVGVAREVRRINGVKPEEDDSDWISRPGSENRTRFLVRFGVAGGVEIPCGRDIVVRELELGREFGLELMLVLRLFLRAERCLSSPTIFVVWSAKSAIVVVWRGRVSPAVQLIEILPELCVAGNNNKCLQVKEETNQGEIPRRETWESKDLVRPEFRPQ